MIDIHTHILPQLDDGSRSVQEAIDMLGIMSKQGVDTIVATPHFYIDSMNPEVFFDKRDAAAALLKNALPLDFERPRISLGAEVQFYPDLASFEYLEKLCFEGTRYILIEMPFCKWPSFAAKALQKLSLSRGITPILAHVERYLAFQKKRDIEELVNDTNALVQVNSEFFLNPRTKRKALGMFKKGLIDFVASDSHNTTTRIPNVGQGIEIISKKFGEDALSLFEDRKKLVTEDLITF